jgi:hypothetical protein
VIKTSVILSCEARPCESPDELGPAGLGLHLVGGAQRDVGRSCREKTQQKVATQCAIKTKLTRYGGFCVAISSCQLQIRSSIQNVSAFGPEFRMFLQAFVRA